MPFVDAGEGLFARGVASPGISSASGVLTPTDSGVERLEDSIVELIFAKSESIIDTLIGSEVVLADWWSTTRDAAKSLDGLALAGFQ